MNKTFLFEAILFYQKWPCYYLFYEEGFTITGEPSPSPYYASISFPVFYAYRQNEGWKINGSEDASFIRQVEGELRKFSFRSALYSQK